VVEAVVVIVDVGMMDDVGCQCVSQGGAVTICAYERVQPNALAWVAATSLPSMTEVKLILIIHRNTENGGENDSGVFVRNQMSQR
jgi:hypothetical protein